MSHTQGPRPMGPRRALPTPPTRDEHFRPPPEMIAALGPPPSAIETRPPQPLPVPPFLNYPPSATPIPSPAPSPGLPPTIPFQAPPPPPPLPGAPAPSEMMRTSRVGLYQNTAARPQLSLSTPSPKPTAPLNIRARPRVEVPNRSIPSDIDSADADDERVSRMSMNRSRPSYSSNLVPGPVLDERSPLPPQTQEPAIPIEATASPGPMIGRIGGGGAGRPKLGLRTSSGSALPDDDAPAPPSLPPIDPGASLTSLRPKLQLPGTNPNPNPSRPKLGLSLGGGGGGGGGLSLNIGGAKSTPSLKLDLSAARGADSDDDADYSYYGFKPTSRRQNSTPLLTGGGSESFPSDSSQATLQPPSTTTAKPIGGNVSLGRVDDGLADVRRAINELRMPELEEELEARERTGSGGDEWSDGVLEVLARLGEGAGGAVCKVQDTRSGRVMARKTIPTGTVPARQLLRELQFSKLVHPNLVVCYGAYIASPPEEGGQNNPPAEIHILMELCEGGALDAIARQMKTRHANIRIGEKVIARLAEGVLKGLDYMHSQKVTHRDIKPSNIVVTRQGVVKLCDFGVSGELEASLANTFTGTSWYMAPERITGNAYSIRADVWSTGLTFLELAQNRFPYPPDLGPIELLTYIVNGEVPELDDEPGDENGNGAIHWSDGMKSFIKQCLRIDAATRPTPHEILDHPWIQESQARKLDMAKWIREVWGWEKPAKAKRASQASQ